MRTTEAARYARWSAMAALSIAVVVAGFYSLRVWREAIARRHAPPPVPEEVHQQSAAFSFSKVDGDRTIFTVRASHATEFKDQNKSVLEDVWITIYGKESNRYDNLHAQQCNYNPASGHIVCQGAVQIDLQSAEEARQTQEPRIIHVATKNISFDRDSGEISTEEPVEFRFPSGEGRGTGISYQTRSEQVRLEKEVELKLSQSTPTALPVVFNGSSLEFGRDERKMVLSGPVRAVQGARTLVAGNLVLEFDEQMHARQAVASGKAELRNTAPQEPATVVADHIVAALDPSGSVERITAEGNVRAHRTLAGGSEDFEAKRVEISMDPKQNQPRAVNATDTVRIASQQNGDSRRLETSALAIRFAANGPSGHSSKTTRIEELDTLAPGTIETKSSDETTRIHAGKFSAAFDGAGRMQQLLGHAGVEVNRQLGKNPPQVSSADDLLAKFDANGEWTRLEESGHMRFRQGDRTAQAGRGIMDRASDQITLEAPPGAMSAKVDRPLIADSQAQTAATSIVVNQRTGEVQASGSVQSSYFTASSPNSIQPPNPNYPNFGKGTAHISADKLVGNTMAGNAVYTGHARLWQGESVIQAGRIEFWRQDQRLDARDNVLALLPQAPQTIQPPDPKVRPAQQKTSPAVLWHVQAPHLQYWGDQGRALLDGGVRAESLQGSLISKTLELFLTPEAPGGKQASAPSGLNNSQRQLSRGLARGGVVVRQGDRQGTAEQGEYFAAEGKFVLSGGQPTITDASRDTTTGRQLTFFTASDTILVESQEGSSTLTKHRVEK
ncbi:MAG: LPS export ABC transporter periplasmic protein LptC [Candidatus Acidiferrales bacterium]